MAHFQERWNGLVTAALFVAGLTMLGYGGEGWAQTSNGHQTGLPTSASPSHSPGTDPMNDNRIPSVSASVTEKMAIARNEERQKRLQADTAQLLALATKLKEDVDKTDKYTLSLDVLKRTTEIEKLAKSIRDRMKE